MNTIPRRAYLDKMTPEELSIYNIVGEVEKLGAHPLLTDVVVLLGEARNKLADWVDLQAAEPLLAGDAARCSATGKLVKECLCDVCVIPF